MGGKKKQKHCSYIKPHAPHVWTRANDEFTDAKTVWCPGVAQATEDRHVHIWDEVSPIYREDLSKEFNDLWNGPFECPCGQSAWLKDGVKKRLIKTEVRFPAADVMERTMALKAKLDRGDEFTEEDKAELQAIADALVEAFKPLVAAFQKMAEQVVEYIASFLDRLDPETVRELHRLAQTYGEPAEAPVETIELRDAMTGEIIAEHVIGHDPIAATQHAATEIVEDALQPVLAPNPSDPVEVAKKALAEPFKEPFQLSLADGEMVGQPSLFESPRAIHDILDTPINRRYLN